MPSKKGSSGRIHSLSIAEERFVLQIRVGSNSIEIEQPISACLEGLTFWAHEVLTVGDIVFWDGQSIQLLVPCLRPERLYEPSGFDIKRSQEWMQFLIRIREFFIKEDFVEVRTPTLVPSPGMEPHLDPFITKFDFGSSSQVFYLPTSPEFHLKRLLCRGWERIFEFKECFRNGELSSTHQPEFLMLEWYRAYSSFDHMKKDVRALWAHLSESLNQPLVPLKEVRVADLFREKLGFELLPETPQGELRALAARLGISTAATDSWDDLFFRIFLEKIEPGLGFESPVMVTSYPPSQAALARINLEGWAERFEVYWKGFEIANAFHELNDSQEQRARFQKDSEAKIGLNKTPVPADEEFLKDLEMGMPPSVGIALGVERLFMAFYDLKRISEARAFPVRIENGSG